mmetsp:Transcript_13449/g.21674  ORF Transcript_13449/g.21674 Transcript_13449/m.21674 type:complete len:358 (-) Transcript_13449:377-1450(-)
MEKKAHEERTKLMEKGKGMINELKEKMGKEIQELTDDVNFLEDKLVKEEEDKKRLGIQFQTKIVEYKKKLQAATGRINSLSSDNDEFEEKVTLLEREISKLREENDRYRRQLGGRSGSDSVLKNQIETLQKEFKSAVDENRELKRKLQSQGQSTLDSIGEDGNSGLYGRTRANQSTLVQLRAEYEETIESLNSEKRELIMKNSAAITDVQKAEKRAWLMEQENSELKQNLTSLKLSNERLENLLSSVQEDTEERTGHHTSMYSNMSTISDLSPVPRPPSAEEASHCSEEGDRYTAKQILSTNQDYSNKTTFTPAGNPPGGFVSPGKDTSHSTPFSAFLSDNKNSDVPAEPAPECKQS